MPPPFSIVRGPIDASAVADAVRDPACGALVLFHGTVRAATRGRRVTRLEYEAYETMAIREMAAIADALRREHDVRGIACAHRVGHLAIGEAAMVVAVAAPHRAAALAATEAFIARLKRDVPIWKKEHFEDGAVWVGTASDPQGEGPQGEGPHGAGPEGEGAGPPAREGA